MASRMKINKRDKKQSQIATDFDRLIVDIAACDDPDVIKYYYDMLKYLEGLAEYRKAMLESAGYGAFLGSNFKKRFDTKDEAHAYLIKKIAAVHDCDEDEIFWEDYDDVGYCRRYWVGERHLWFYSSDRIATISSVDEDNKEIHVFRLKDTPPDTPDGLNYQSSDEMTQKLSHLVKENELLKSELNSSRQKNAHAWDEVNTAKMYFKGKEARKKLDDWLRLNKDLLHHDDAK